MFVKLNLYKVELKFEESNDTLYLAATHIEKVFKRVNQGEELDYYEKQEVISITKIGELDDDFIVK